MFFCNTLVLRSFNSDLWKRYTLRKKKRCWGKGGRVSSALGSMWGLLSGLLCETSGRRKLYIVPCHSCYIYGIWSSKEVKKALNLSFAVATQAIRRDNFYRKEGFSLCNTAVWNFTVSFTGYCKLFYRILPPFPILMLFYPFCIYWDWQGQKSHLKCLKVYDINTEL